MTMYRKWVLCCFENHFGRIVKLHIVAPLIGKLHRFTYYPARGIE